MKTDLASIFNAEASQYDLNEIFLDHICKTLRTLRCTLWPLRLIEVKC